MYYRNREWFSAQVGALRLAVRSLRRVPGYSAACIVTLGLGVGASTLLFSIVHTVLLKPLPFPDGHKLVALSHWYADKSGTQVSPANLRDYSTHTRVFESLAGFTGTEVVLTGVDRAERLSAQLVTEEFFQTLRVQPVLGRTLTAADYSGDAGASVVLSEGVWKRIFGSERDVIGRTILLNREETTVVGVVPLPMTLPGGGDVWQPLRLSSAWYSDEMRGEAEILNVIGRLRATASVDHARAQLHDVAASLRDQFPALFPSEGGWAIAVVPLRELVVGATREPLLLLQGASVFLLMIATANVANLMLARALSRRQEIAIYKALGAGVGRVASSLLIEALILGAAGLVTGMGIARLGAEIFARSTAGTYAGGMAGQLDGSVIWFAVGVALVSTLVSCLAALLRMASVQPSVGMGNDARSAAAGSILPTQRLLVISAAALTFALLVGVGLMSRSLYNLSKVDLGFSTAGVTVASLQLSGGTSRDARRAHQFLPRLVDQLEQRPGIAAAGAGLSPPFIGQRWKTRFVPEDLWRSSSMQEILPEAELNPVTSNYFSAAGIPVLEGRSVDDRHEEGSPKYAVVNHTLAQRYWPGKSAVGERIATNPDWGDEPDWLTVIGVVGDVRTESMTGEPSPTIYEPLAQSSGGFGTLLVRSTMSDESVARLIREEVERLDPGVAVYDVRPMGGIIAQQTASRRLSLSVAFAFAVSGVLLAGVGLYGVMNYHVKSRTREFAVRISLGAQRNHITWLVLRHAGGLLLLGLLLGILLAIQLSAYLRGLLFGVSETDPVTYLGLAAFLTAVVAVAAYRPARKAALTDPNRALRAE